MMGVSVLSGISCHLGEGPSYDLASDTLQWFDILERRLHGLQLSTGKTSLTTLPVMGSAIFGIDGDRQLILTERGFYIRYRQTGVTSFVIPVEDHNAATRSNDARAHPCGAVWFGTMGKNAETGAGAIYHLLKGKVTKLYPDISIPNAICFSPDGSIAYFTDTKVNKLMRVAIDPATALPTGDPKVLVDHSGNPGGIDGAIVDTDGVIWNARWGIGQLDAISPDGRLLREIEMPAKQTTCPAFIGHAFNRLAVTSASEGYSDPDRSADPDCGKTFLVDLPVFGRAEPNVLF